MILCYYFLVNRWSRIYHNQENGFFFSSNSFIITRNLLIDSSHHSNTSIIPPAIQWRRLAHRRQGKAPGKVGVRRIADLEVSWELTKTRGSAGGKDTGAGAWRNATYVGVTRLDQQTERSLHKLYEDVLFLFASPFHCWILKNRKSKIYIFTRLILWDRKRYNKYFKTVNQLDMIKEKTKSIIDQWISNNKIMSVTYS